MNKITFELENNQKVNIFKDGVQVGHIFSPSGSGGFVTNAIQVCGFDEAFDYWGCGVFHGKRDIQLLFDKEPVDTKNSYRMIGDCYKCYGPNGCICVNKDISDMPYSVVRQQDLGERIQSTQSPGLKALQEQLDNEEQQKKKE